MENEEQDPELVSISSSKSTLRRKKAIKLRSGRTSPWKERQMRKKSEEVTDPPKLKPPLPPKPNVADLIRISKVPRKFSQPGVFPQKSQTLESKMILTKSQSYHHPFEKHHQSHKSRDSDSLIARRTRFFQQISNESQELAKTKVLKKPSLTVYVDLNDTESADDDSSGGKSTDPNVSLAKAERLLSNISVSPDSSNTSRRRIDSSRLQSISSIVDELKHRFGQDFEGQDTLQVYDDTVASVLSDSSLQSQASGSVPKSESFSLFKDTTKSSDESLSSLSNGTKTNFDDTGYVSESDLSNVSTTTVKNRFKGIFESFGKGPRLKKAKVCQRPVIEHKTGEVDLPKPPESFETIYPDGNFIHPDLRKGETADMFEPNSNRDSFTSGSSSSSELQNRDGNDSREDLEIDEDKGVLIEDRKSKKLFNAAKEIMTSEEAYVTSLRIILRFRELLDESMKKKSIMPKEEAEKLFPYIKELLTLNTELLKDFRDRIQKWEESPKIADVLVEKGQYLKLYTTYLQNFSDLSDHFDECCRKYEHFNSLVKTFEAEEQCRNLKIPHFLLKPVQRLPQYRILLETYLKYLEETSEDFDNAQMALRIVSEANDHANDQIKHNDNFKNLLMLQDRLRESDLVQPNRDLVKFGEIQKISRSGTDLRFLILCSDVLIYAKYAGSLGVSDNYWLKSTYRIPLNLLQVSVPKPEEYPLEFCIVSQVRSCTLQAPTVAERKSWVNAIEKTIDNLLQKKATFSNAATFEKIPKTSLGEKAPVWVPDKRVTMCQMCHCDFTLLIRRHHCRACGKVVCHYCSANKAPLKYCNYEAERVCNHCFKELWQIVQSDKSLRNLKSKFKRDLNAMKPGTKAVPQRLKISANDEDAQMSGYLHRYCAKIGKFRKMWFVLKDHVLYEFKASEDIVANQTFPILGFDLHLEREVPSELLQSVCSGFTLTHSGSEKLRLFSETEQSAEKWKTALLEALSIE